MALPKLNQTIKYELEIPSSGKKVTFRPYFVKEEKILLLAFESGDQKQAMRAMVDTVVACVFEDINPNALSTFDVEYMFTQIRSKSVGETSEIKIKCQAEGCGHMSEVVVNLTEVEVKKNDVSNIIELTPEVSIEMQYPTYTAFVKNFEEGISEGEFGFKMLEDCIVAVMTEEERFDKADMQKQELLNFIDSMTSSQFSKVGEFVSSAPTMRKEIEFACTKCGNENKTVLEGIQDFF